MSFEDCIIGRELILMTIVLELQYSFFWLLCFGQDLMSTSYVPLNFFMSSEELVILNSVESYVFILLFCNASSDDPPIMCSF